MLQPPHADALTCHHQLAFRLLILKLVSRGCSNGAVHLGAAHMTARGIKHSCHAAATAAEEKTAEEEAEPEEPKFQAFVGQGRRLDGKPATTSSAPITAGTGSSSAAGASPSAGSAAGGAAPARAGKAGTFVNISSGNRLLDKLQKQQQVS
jgi:hypothetical protein